MTTNDNDERVALLRELIRDVPDFPKPGILFKDIMPLLADPTGLRITIQLLEELAEDLPEADEVDYIVGMESRGFIFGAALANQMGCGFVAVRKPGRLPAETHQIEYALEYGTDKLEIHKDALPEGAKVLVVDDLLATGGTANATAQLIEKCGASVVGNLFVIDLAFLGGAAKLAAPSKAILTYE